MDLPSRFIVDCNSNVSSADYTKALEDGDYGSAIAIRTMLDSATSKLIIVAEVNEFEDISAISFTFNLNAADISGVTEVSFDILDREELYIGVIDIVVRFISKHFPNIKIMRFMDVTNDAPRSIVLYGQFYIESCFYVYPEGIDIYKYADHMMEYVGEDLKKATSWSEYLEKHPALLDYAESCEKAYNESRRIVDFARTCETILPAEVFAKFINEAVIVEIGYIPTAWVYNFEHVFMRDDSDCDSDSDSDYANAADEPHCCLCKECPGICTYTQESSQPQI
jgi:hypothetical protein